ncbi:MAG: hypothetical protein HN576_06835 [Bacteriovoracaceae bacterium]|jgi:hypothetical protein|nr:hypothetical protein [Bacteriovoracaceae bacterium]
MLIFFFTFLHSKVFGCSSVKLVEIMETQEFDTYSSARLMMEDIRDCLQERKSTMYIFPTVYVMITNEIEKKINSYGFYRNPNWMESIVIDFFKLYRYSLLNYEKGRKWLIPNTWLESFNYSKTKNASGFKSLILSMHAHINRDLAVAIHRKTPQISTCYSCKADYFATNEMFREILPELWDTMIILEPDVNSSSYENEVYEDELMRILIASRKAAWDLAVKVQTSPNVSIMAIDKRANRLTPLIKLVPDKISKISGFILNLLL